MSSAGELWTRIELLAADILCHTDDPKSTEQQLSITRSQLNAILDPIGRLPLEISSDIFLHYLPTPPTWEALSLLLLVSHAWNSIALSTPSLWNAIGDHRIPPARFTRVWEAWLDRGRDLPVSLSIRHIDRASFASIATNFGKHAPRFQTMELSPTGGTDLGRLTSRAHFGGLKSLTIQMLDDSYGSLEPFLELLRGAPDLVECNIVGTTFLSASTSLTHSTLQHLRIGTMEQIFCDAFILRHLTLPSLQTLCVSRYGIQVAHLHDFLVRSSPPLTSLQIILRVGDTTNETMRACLGLLGGLTDLGIVLPDAMASSLDLFTSAPHLLPVLQSLTVYEVFGHIQEGCRRILDFLAKRHASLRSFRLIIPDGQEEALGNADAPALREFQDQGIQIHVGTEQMNFL
ncbi:hypothetical protein FB45DRAFT_1130723 [Roridomyces roridus]|uniref:F-box domain-containing protein n=1 Tax=Roridomyces roridus TaxID=1738132 RepID=A0AAD7B2M0_9AGAR|nr:hypothetical protein FB45DRAFT_1130723 [Roridomyces roridus]